MPELGPAATEEEAVDTPEHVDSRKAGRAESGPRERREFVSLMASRVRDVFVRKPFFVEGTTDIITLCRELATRGQTILRQQARIAELEQRSLTRRVSRWLAKFSRSQHDRSE